MAGPVAGNEIARRVVDDLIEFSGETVMDGNQIAQLNALIAEMEAFDNPGEVFDTLMRLRDDVRVEDAKLLGLNDVIAQAEEEIEMKEAYAEYSSIRAYLVCPSHFVYMGPFLILDKLSEVAESPHLVDKMKYVFGRSHGKDESLAGLIAKGAVKCLEHMGVIVARDVVTLGELETLLGRAQVLILLVAVPGVVPVTYAATLGDLEQLLAGSNVGMRLKASYVAVMEETN
ncbi:hypothetical protein Tco_0689205 [Tanacetum coccineum]